MKHKSIIFITIVTLILVLKSCASQNKVAKSAEFNKERDLLLVQLDSKTDVDDLHTAAALATLLSDSKFSKIHFHAVAGTYGIQEGLYVPPNELLKLAFENNWTDAHEDFNNAIEKVQAIVKTTLANQGDIWIAEAGQSDFTASLIKKILSDIPGINTSKRVHVVQHSDWNEKSTSPEHLQYVKSSTDYQKIPDGNVVGNGTPGFMDPDFSNWKDKIKVPKLIKIWNLSTEISNEYNGKEGRYTNKAIVAGGLDFSDLAEVCWILGLNEIEDTTHFFKLFSN